MPQSQQDSPFLSVVVPVFNEQDNVETLWARLVPVLESLGRSYEVLFVDDGSTDATRDRLEAMAAKKPGLCILSLARNFGHQAALFAGIEHARGQAVVTMDGDLQHPPELIPQLVDRWQAGGEVVQAIRTRPADAGRIKRATSGLFYRVLSRLSRIDVSPGAADFRLLARPAVEAFCQCRERCRFNRGLVLWIGFRYCEVPYDAEPRHAGRSKYSLPSMVRLAGDAVLSFSTVPLRLAGLAGLIVSLAAAAYLLFVLWARLFTDRTEPGWSSLLATMLVIGGVQLIVLWILGEYVGRLYEEAKQRPIYILRAQDASSPASPPASAAQSGVRNTRDVRPAGQASGRNL